LAGRADQRDGNFGHAEIEPGAFGGVEACAARAFRIGLARCGAQGSRRDQHQPGRARQRIDDACGDLERSDQARALEGFGGPAGLLRRRLRGAAYGAEQLRLEFVRLRLELVVLARGEERIRRTLRRGSAGAEASKLLGRGGRCATGEEQPRRRTVTGRHEQGNALARRQRAKLDGLDRIRDRDHGIDEARIPRPELGRVGPTMLCSSSTIAVCLAGRVRPATSHAASSLIGPRGPAAILGSSVPQPATEAMDRAAAASKAARRSTGERMMIFPLQARWCLRGRSLAAHSPALISTYGSWVDTSRSG
jgi:hypothetical protein